MSTAAPLQQQGGGTDASVLLGLEELERQQADLEKRRANEAAAFRYGIDSSCVFVLICCVLPLI